MVADEEHSRIGNGSEEAGGDYDLFRAESVHPFSGERRHNVVRYSCKSSDERRVAHLTGAVRPEELFVRASDGFEAAEEITEDVYEHVRVLEKLLEGFDDARFVHVLTGGEREALPHVGETVDTGKRTDNRAEKGENLVNGCVRDAELRKVERGQVFLPQKSTVARKATKKFASVLTLTSSMSLPTGIITSLLPSALLRMASIQPSRCPVP